MNTDKTQSANQHRGGCCCAGKSSAFAEARDTGNVNNTSLPLQRLQVQGATCGGCVKSIEQTLKSVAGVSEASMDLATGIASVFGVLEPNNLVEALGRAGFPATVIG